MVAPLLEIPGSMATACAMPIANALRKDTFLSVVLAKSAKYNKNAVMINMMPTITMAPSKKTSIKSFKKRPTKAAGIMEMIIFKENWVSSFHLN